MGEYGRPLAAGVALLERAIDYTLGSLRSVTPAVLCRATPCSGWNLHHLLEHLGDSLRTLTEAATGHVAGCPHTTEDLRDRPATGADPALLVRDGAAEMLGGWSALRDGDAGTVCVGNQRLTGPMVAAAGAIEIAVHGWDVARSCGERRPIPPLMAEELLDLARLFVTCADRPSRFAPPMVVPAYAPAQDHLLAHLGRDPDWFAHN
ncbi:TIGR03086 family protein [Nonomuraea terrae]|uniref:TIGR03086 family protein n=1 Tax=Nonomuraea terrae TaxID=2530383 RepID=A0A4V2YK76_9ACTN|nr:TIGR03086 family metal-binding protein [Nonomuraea terrae]TDD41317.1 TIGR03086 family protein [Nonomuraea terrae]